MLWSFLPNLKRLVALTPSKTTVTILLVEDNLGDADLLQEFLETESAEQLQIHHHQRLGPALQDLKQRQFDLVLLDLSLPDSFGLETFTRLRAQCPHIPVVILSGLGDEAIALEAVQMGAQDYLVKGEFDDYLLLRAIRYAIARHRQVTAESVQMKAELARAGQIQADLLPDGAPTIPGFELVARCIPAKVVGGDFYDWYLPSADLLNLTLADVSGKGMPAALLMASIRATFRSAPVQSSPAQNVRFVASALESELERADSFVTLVHGQVQIEQRQLAYVDAGHGHGFFRRANGSIEPLNVSRTPIGAWYPQPYQACELTFNIGDALVLYSDGVIDARPELNLTPHMLAGYLAGSQNAEEMLNRIVALTHSDQAVDDLTVLILRCIK